MYRTHQGAAGDFAGVARLGQGIFVDGHIVVAGRDQAAVVHVDGHRGGAFVTVGIAQGVGEHIARARAADRIRVAVVQRVAGRIQGQVAIGAVDLAVQAAMHRGRGVGAGTHADHTTAGELAIGPRVVVPQHIAADVAAFSHGCNVDGSGRYVIDDVDHDGAGDAVAQAIDGLVGEAFVQGVGAVVGLWRGAGRRGQGVGVAAIRVQQ
ncbi:hypothetical protein D3C78_1344330 [compost metagenome]